jgi:phosphoribosylformylglycinamidine synthase
VRDLDADGLLAVSRDRRAALDLAEMQAVQAYYRSNDRDPTDVELEMIVQTWSEHCVHKTFKAKVVVSGQSSVVSHHSSLVSAQPPHGTHHADHNTSLLTLLSSPNIASKSSIIRIYDHEVQGGTVVKPLTGVNDDGPSDACVLKPIGTRGTRGLVLSNGINPELGKLDTHAMAVNVIDEAIRNAVAVGADPDRMALLDNFCWGDPLRPETLGSLIEAARGCYEAAVYYRAPFISGKDSLNNEYLGSDGLRHAIPPTRLISAIGLIDDVSQAVTMDAKEAGNLVYLLNAETTAREMYRALHTAMTAGLVRACHDVSDGGLAVTAAEMCIGGRLSMALTLQAMVHWLMHC